MKAAVQAFLPIITLMPLVMLVMNLSIVAVLWFGGFWYREALFRLEK